MPDLIITDTLARVAVGADENSAKDMGQVVDGFETIKRETGATVLVIITRGRMAWQSADRVPCAVRQKSRFADNGAAHKELKQAFVDSGADSASSFDRAFRLLKKSGRVHLREKRYFAASVEEIERVEKDSAKLRQLFAERTGASV